VLFRSNIYQELASDLGVAQGTNGDLTRWGKQGVLLLNSVLTVRQFEPFSHRGKGWERFTDAVIRLLNARTEPVVFILWGRPAQEKAKWIDEQKHVIMRSPHPSPLSAYRGFFGSRPFSRTNEHLKKIGFEPILW
jgi:uracil-DNA glycosylase